MATESSSQRRLAVGAILLEKGRVLLVYNRRPGGGGHWSLPKGSSEAGEPLVDTLRREVQEETGLEVEPVKLAFVTEFYVPPRNEWFLQHYFHARALRGRAAVQPLDPDVTQVRWVPFPELSQYLTFRPWSEPLQRWLRDRHARYYIFP